MINRTIYTTRLLRRHIRWRSQDELWRFGRLLLARKSRCDAETRQPNLVGSEIDEHIGWLEVFVVQATFVQPTKSS